MSTPNIPNATELHAAGAVTGAAGVLGANAVNIVSVVRNGAGDYTITMAQAIAQATRTIKVQAINAAGRAATVVDTSSTVFEALIWDLAVPGAADSDFYFEVKRRSVP